MSLFVKMFFRSDKEIAPKDIFLSLLASGLHLTPSSREEWERTTEMPESGINFQYDLSLRPIRIYYSSDGSAIDLSTRILNELQSECSVPSDIVDRLQHTKQCIDIEVNPDSISQQTWSLLDVFEQDMLSNFDGILYVHDEGIYDSDLTMLFEIE